MEPTPEIMEFDALPGPTVALPGTTAAISKSAIGQPPVKRQRVPDPSKAPKHTSITKLLHQKALTPNLSTKQLAKINNVSQQAVSQMFQRYGINENYLESFKLNRADILSGLQDTVLSTLDLEDIKAASFRDRTVAFGILYDKERLERGQSTSNVATILATAVIEAGKQWAKPVVAQPGQVIDVDPD